VDEKILPLIPDTKTAKEAWDALDRCFVVRGSTKVEDEGGSIAADLHGDEMFVQSHYAQLQVDEYLVNIATKLANDNLVNPTTELAGEISVNLATELDEDNEVSVEVANFMVNPSINIVDVNFDEDLLTKDEKL